MKNLNMLIWMTQLGLSIVLPPVCFILIALWLQNQFDFGQWVLWIGIILGIYTAIQGLRGSLKAMEQMSKDKSEEKPKASFNDHD